MLQDQVLPRDHEAALVVDGFERLRDPSHHRAFDEDEWLAMFQRAGFKVEHRELYRKRHDFIPWARRQGNDAATIAKLIQMLREAPPIAREWMDPQAWGSDGATFLNRHILIRGRLS